MFDTFSKVLLTIALLCFLLAGLFHTFLRVDEDYPEHGDFNHPHLVYVWRSTNTVAVQF